MHAPNAFSFYNVSRSSQDITYDTEAQRQYIAKKTRG